MDLKSGYPYWVVKNGLMHAFPQLDADVIFDVAVVGTGNLVRRDACWGNTSASTVLLQHGIDTHATDPARHCEQASALLACQSCLDVTREINPTSLCLAGINES